MNEMKILNIKNIFVVIIVSCLCGCSDMVTTIYYNRTFEEIRDMGRSAHLPFCIVLTDSAQNLSNEYCKQLQTNYNSLICEAIYNVVNVELLVNEWYLKWLSPVSTSLTCVFSFDGQLIALIPGAARESFLYVKEAIKNLVFYPKIQQDF